uniref:Uncharacterized protein n=1 Tax=Amphimedon queenslandica TaxID=400682 RepID=A0A1X7SWD1_AMPQE
GSGTGLNFNKGIEGEQDEGATVKGDEPLTVLWSNTDRLTPSTSVHYVTQNASLIFVIDMTSSMMQVSNETFSVKLDEAVRGLEKCLSDLIQPVSCRCGQGRG